ncbi:crosslink repair DNA glycosylase YcaQ family protein [Sorangium sp. So ce1504]
MWLLVSFSYAGSYAGSHAGSRAGGCQAPGAAHRAPFITYRSSRTVHRTRSSSTAPTAEGDPPDDGPASRPAGRARRAAPRRHAPDESVRLLAPFDPVVWDRRRFELLWGWAYRFEAYVPAPNRKLGYHALPLPWGELDGPLRCTRAATPIPDLPAYRG